MPSQKVLVIDDDEAYGRSLARAMEERGFEARALPNGESALKLVESYVPDVVLCDLVMPVMDGYELCAELRLKPELSDTLFVAHTGWGLKSGEKKSVCFDHHIEKPLDLDRLQSFIDAHGATRH